jgi:hypothetical protein
MWNITNSTSGSKKNLVVIDASVDSDSPGEFYYDQHTTLLSLSSNEDYIVPGKSGSVVIPDVHKDKLGNSLTFTFIIAEAETLAPVKSVTCIADLSDLEDLTIDDGTIDTIQTVFDFNRNITAFPYSDLATGFAALDYTDEHAVNSFFNNTRDYQEVTLDSWHLVRSYYNALPYGWANGKDTTIYLYSGTFENNLDTDVVRSIGSISITNNWTLPLPLTVPDPFKIELKLSDDTTVQLVFSNGVFWDSGDAETARLSLAGSFIVPSQLALGNRKNDIVTFLAGTINGNKAFGMEGDAPNGKDDDGGLRGLFDVHSVKEGLTLAMYFIGLALGIGILVKLGMFVRWYRNYGKPTVDQRERTAQTEDLKKYITEKVSLLATQVNSQIRVPQQNEMPADQAALKQQQVKLKTDQAKENIRKMADAQYDALDLISSKYSSTDLQLAFDNLGRVEYNMNDADMDFNDLVGDSMARLSHNTETIIAARTFIASHLTADETKAYKESMKVYEDARVILEDNAREIKAIEAGQDEREIIEES